MTLHSSILFLHILSAIGLFIGYGLEWIGTALLRRAASGEQARAWLRVYRVSPPLSGASLAVLILTGGYLASLMGAMKQGWIAASLLGIVVAFFLGIAINLPRVRAIRGAVSSVEGTLSAELRARLQDAVLVTAVRVRTLLAVGIVYLMTAKPAALSTSFVVLGLATVVGVALSAPAWARTEPPKSA